MSKWKVGPNGEGSWADFNNDGIIDEDADFPGFKSCYLAATEYYTGTNQSIISNIRPECNKYDINKSGQVQVLDFNNFGSMIKTGIDPKSGVQLEQILYTRPEKFDWTKALLVGGIAFGVLFILKQRKKRR